MTLVHAIILGIVQGLTEFLPVSSSGHLLLLQKLGIGEPSIFFNIALHMGTLLAVVVYFRKDIWQIIRKPFTPYNCKLLISTIITVVIALIFRKYFEDVLIGKYLASGFLLTAILLFVAQMRLGSKRYAGEITYRASIFAGLMQGLAVLPGISRSGATITTLLLGGADRKEAGKYSFLLSIPIIIGAFIMELPRGAAESVEVFPLVAGMLFAFVCGLAAIRLFIRLLSNRSLIPFCIYLVVLSIVMLFWL